MSDKVQISETTASALICCAGLADKGETILELWKHYGYIKQSKLEEARDMVHKLSFRYCMGDVAWMDITNLAAVYEDAIRKMQNG